MFYNIIVSKPFAEKHNIKTQDCIPPIIPLIADYTRNPIAALVAKYPNVGLMVALAAMGGMDTERSAYRRRVLLRICAGGGGGLAPPDLTESGWQQVSLPTPSRWREARAISLRRAALAVDESGGQEARTPFSPLPRGAARR